MKHKVIEYTEKELQNEIWKPIPNYENDYEASSLGRIRTATTKTSYTKRHGVRHWKQRILKPKCTNENAYKTGYRVSLWKNGEPQDFLVCRLVASTFIKNELFDRTLTVNHIDGNRFNNKIENLEWCSLKENIQKGFKTGLFKMQCVDVLNRKTFEKKRYKSLSCASRKMGYNHGYLSQKIKQEEFVNDKYCWLPVFNVTEGEWEAL